MQKDPLGNTKKCSLNFLGYSEILSLIKSESLRINPFIPELLSCNKIDLRITDELIRLKNTNENFDVKTRNDYSLFFEHEKNSEFIIHPNERVLMSTIESVQLSTNLVGIVGLRSTYSRLGWQANTGFVDPGFVGQLTLEILGSSFPIRVYSGDAVFHMTLARVKPQNSWAYEGKYQRQEGPTLPKFKHNRASDG